MEILAHGLWAAAASETAKKLNKGKPIRTKLAVFFGTFPDILAFTILIIWYGFQILMDGVHARNLPSPSEFEPSMTDTIWIFRLTTVLYSLSHSAIVFGFIALIVFIIKRRVAWELFGWLLHILIDVFTHTYATYPTPVLWPISSWKFDGISWDTLPFFIINYSAIIVIYALFIIKDKHFNDLKISVAKYRERYQDFRAKYITVEE